MSPNGTKIGRQAVLAVEHLVDCMRFEEGYGEGFAKRAYNVLGEIQRFLDSEEQKGRNHAGIRSTQAIRPRSAGEPPARLLDDGRRGAGHSGLKGGGNR